MRKNILHLILFAALLFSITTGWAQELSGRPGAFADVGLGLRALGMGGAYSALASDENGARWNPSLLADIQDYNSGFTWTKQFSLIDYHYLAFAMPVADKFGCGTYVITAGDDVYRETTIGLAGGIAASRLSVPIDNLNFGLTVKILMASYGNNSDGDEDRVTGDAFGYAFDAAVHYQVSDCISTALVMRDVVNNIDWNSSVKGDYSEGTPRTLALAWAMVKEKFTLGMEYHPGLYSDVKDRVVVGGELVWLKIFRPRFGFAQDLTSGETNRWVTLGFGIELTSDFLRPFDKVQFGYTHMLHEIDPSPRVGLSMVW